MSSFSSRLPHTSFLAEGIPYCHRVLRCNNNQPRERREHPGAEAYIEDAVREIGTGQRSSQLSRTAVALQHSSSILCFAPMWRGEADVMEIVGLVMLGSVALWLLQQFERTDW